MNNLAKYAVYKDSLVTELEIACSMAFILKCLKWADKCNAEVGFISLQGEWLKSNL